MVHLKGVCTSIITAILLSAYQPATIEKRNLGLMSPQLGRLGERAIAAEKAPAQSLTISDRGIGSALLGMTVGKLKQTLGSKAQFQVSSPYQVDFDALAVSQSGKVQYRIIYPARTKLKDTEAIELLMTDNSNYKTAQGVKPGMTLKQAEAIYGKATLSYHIENESRERVIFAKQPSQKISFVPKVKGKQVAGIYGAGKGGYFETNQYQPNAVIESIWVRK
ncbi:MAG: hypothetical protein ACM37W_19170 [Actinomycetota bacterium]